MGNYLKVVLTPFGSPGNAVSFVADRRGKIHDKHTVVKFHSIYNLLAQFVAWHQPKKDKITIVASMMVSLSCKPANIVSIFLISF